MRNISHTEARFIILRQNLIDENIFVSSLNQIHSHPAYLEIINMGNVVLPFIIHELDKNMGVIWFDALRKITGENPVLESHKGNISQMSKDWKEWWKENKNKCHLDK